MGVVLLARCVVDLSVVLFAVVVVVVVVVVNIVGGNFLRLPKGEAMSFGLFLSEAEKLAFFGGLFLSGRNLLSSAILKSCCSWHVFFAAASICGTSEFQKAHEERAPGAADTTATVRSGLKLRYLRPLVAEYRGQAPPPPSPPVE